MGGSEGQEWRCKRKPEEGGREGGLGGKEGVMGSSRAEVVPLPRGLNGLVEGHRGRW